MPCNVNFTYILPASERCRPLRHTQCHMLERDQFPSDGVSSQRDTGRKCINFLCVCVYISTLNFSILMLITFDLEGLLISFRLINDRQESFYFTKKVELRHGNWTI